MNNPQLAAARKVQNRYPDVAFLAAPGGMMVRSVFVPIGPNMSPEDVRKALIQEAVKA
jgi:hypothetical protein